MKDTKSEIATVDLHDRIHDAYYGKMGKELMRQTQERIHWVCQQVRGKSVLDVGCSQGVVPLLLAREGLSVTGIDSDQDAIRFAETLAANETERAGGLLKFICNDFLSHVFSERFDTVVMSEVLEHLTRPDLFLERAADILKKSGTIVVTVPFGINDFIDHKATYYLLGPYRHLSKQYDVKSIKIGQNWIGFSGQKRVADVPDQPLRAVDAEFVDLLESSFLALERSLRTENANSVAKLQEANKKYRSATEQVATLRSQVALVESQKSEVVGQHQKDVARADGSLSQLRAQLDSANLKCREVTERYAELKATLAEVELLRKEASAKHEVSLGLQKKLENEKAVLQQEHAKERNAFDAAMREGSATIRLLEATCTDLEKRLFEADFRCKSAQEMLEEARSVQRRHEGERALLQQQAAEDERAFDKSLREKADAIRLLEATCADLEKRLFEADFRCNSALDMLEEARSIWRRHEEELDALQQQAAENRRTFDELVREKTDAVRLLEAACVDLHKRLSDADALHRVTQDALGALQAQLAYREEEKAVLESKLAEGEFKHGAVLAQLEVAIFAKKEVEDEAVALQLEFAESKRLYEEVLGEKSRELHALEEINSALKSQIGSILEKHSKEMLAVEEAFAEEAGQLKVRIDSANKKYRDSTTQYANIKADYARLQEESRAVRDELRLRIDGLLQEAKKQRQLLEKANRESEKLRNDLLAARNQVAKTRAMLSFQLGYVLIHAFESFRGFMALPGSLWKISREAARRRQQGRRRESEVGPAGGASVLDVPLRNGGGTNPPPATESTSQPVVTVVPAAQQALERQGTIVFGKKQETGRDLKAIRVACIMDEFTFSSYKHECDLFALSPAAWRDELAAFGPDVLFIESAWRGKDDQWGNKVGHLSQEVVGILSWCRDHQVPTMFWNKEDPVHFDTFLNTARLFDHVFTTDIDCIERYKAALGHGRVWLLPFAVQPASFNPVEAYERKDAFCFAGAYYVRYPERTRDLGNFISHLAAYRPVEIYDRNFGKDDANYQFPEDYKPYILGNLPYDQIDKAYKGYRFGINLNSIKQSQTMFARRVFELLASNTIVVSNFSRGIRLMFGDLVITSDSGDELVSRLQEVEARPAGERRLRLAGLRKVMSGHTYQDRFAYAMSRMTLGASLQLLPTISVIAHVSGENELGAIVECFRRQAYPAKRLRILASYEGAQREEYSGEDIQIVAGVDPASSLASGFIGDAEWVASLCARDYYGPNYLLDLALATRYSMADVVGKAACYAVADGQKPVLVGDGLQYRYVESIPARGSISRGALWAHVSVDSWVSQGDSLALQVERECGVLAVDEFNYCRDGACASLEEIASIVDDLAGVDVGIDIDVLTKRAECIPPAPQTESDAPMISGAQLGALLPKPRNPAIQYQVDGHGLSISSSLPDGKHDYVYLTSDFRASDLGFTTIANLYLDVSLGLNIQLTVHFLDAQKQRISHVVKQSNRNHAIEVPIGAEWVRIGLRVYAGGTAEVRGLVLGHRAIQPPAVIGRARCLLVTNHYPSYSDLYRNGFVHTRMREYARNGLHVDVFRVRPDENVSFHEFQNVDVITGSAETLRRLLNSQRYEHVLVHFLDQPTWHILRDYVDDTPMTVWVHGAEIQPFHRREFNFTTEAERSKALQASEQRVGFWKSLLEPMPENLMLVFVSRYLADQVMEDLGVAIPAEQYRVICNPIDTRLFCYKKKPSSQRKKILSIRPYASATYANDLSVKAILALRDKPWFGELEFRMVGDGPLFESTLEPLRGLDNVIIEKGFLTREEIASLHKEYGVFLCPSRMDTHGVSRDEAMASGLVPITSAVGAIPEFVDETCGFLAPPEDVGELVRGITLLREDEALFRKMSEASSARISMSRAIDSVVAKEIRLIREEVCWVR